MHKRRTPWRDSWQTDGRGAASPLSTLSSVYPAWLCSCRPSSVDGARSAKAESLISTRSETLVTRRTRRKPTLLSPPLLQQLVSSFWQSTRRPELGTLYAITELVPDQRAMDDLVGHGDGFESCLALVEGVVGALPPRVLRFSWRFRVQEDVAMTIMSRSRHNARPVLCAPSSGSASPREARDVVQELLSSLWR